MGKYPTLTSQNARKKNIEIKELLSSGINPKDKKKERIAKQDGFKLFHNIAQAWYADHKTFLAPSTFSRNYSAYLTSLLWFDLVVTLKFDAKRPNESWVSDITYIWTNEGWLYLAGVKDLYTNDLVGYAFNKCMTADLICRALNMAIKNKRPSKGLIVHSDRGSQYCSHAYHKVIKQ